MKMEIPDKQKNIFLVDCPPKPKIDEKLEWLIVVIKENTTNVVIDFSDVNLITGSNISALLKLRKFLEDEGHQLILSGLSPAIRGIFERTHLDNVFEFADDRFIALATLSVA